jgi:predicted ATP-dependent serine protease
LAEAARLGFDRAVVPATVELDHVGIELHRVGTVSEAIVAARLMPGDVEKASSAA